MDTSRRSDQVRPTSIAAVLLTGLTLLAMPLAFRRVGGYFSQDLTPGTACVVVLGGCMLSFVSFSCLLLGPHLKSAGHRWTSLAGTIAPTVLLSAAVVPTYSLSAVTATSAAIIVLVVTGSLAVIEVEWLRNASARLLQSSTDEIQPTNPSANVRIEPADEDTAGEVTQQLTRRTVTDAGETWETIEGTLSVEFAVGEKSVSVHVPIHPPLAAAPEVEWECLSEASITCKSGDVQRHGVRADIRRTSAATTERIAMGYVIAARVPSESDSAAA